VTAAERDPAPRPLEIAILLSSLGLVRGGLESAATRLAEGLVRRGHGVTVVAGWVPGERLAPDLSSLPVRWLRVPCVPVTFAGWPAVARGRPGLPLKAQSLTFGLACRTDPRVRAVVGEADITVTALEIETVLVSSWRAQRGRPHVSLFPGVIGPSWLARDRSTVRLAISEYVAELARRHLDLRVDEVVFLAGPPAAWLEVPYAVRDGARTLLFVGRLDRGKGVHELLALFEALAPSFPDLELKLAGDGAERRALERRIAAAGLGRRVQLLGALRPQEILRELTAADLFVFPSRYESWGLAVVEAMAAGVPVVAGDVAALREVAGDAACLLPPADTVRWRETVARLIANAAERRALSAAGRARAANFTAERAVGLTERWLFRALEPSAAHAGSRC